ncbi:energy-coupling factor ABC transporter permease [uncultured Thiodictyon sp.]|uniref:energy-coupling factor ABC transporter permease n=1 Tax=uncultured Thiodictyon sp. TaxID=1846217 RepID=UPI0025FE545D|nr:energy-coupling factor ABC transporter permease [uncultured Thiodictyon sp.]
MHIMEGFLPPLHAAAWGLASLPFLVMGARRIARITREQPRTKLLLASAGAFTQVPLAIIEGLLTVVVVNLLIQI